MGSGDYVKGVIALAKSLRVVQSSYSLIVAVTDCVPMAHWKQLVREGCIVRDIEKVKPPKSARNIKFACDYYIVNYSKLRIWQVRGAILRADSDKVGQENGQNLRQLSAWIRKETGMSGSCASQHAALPICSHSLL
jgi:hypothetical protein